MHMGMENFSKFNQNDKTSLTDKIKKAAKFVVAATAFGVATLGNAEAQQTHKIHNPQEQTTNLKTKWAQDRAEEVARDMPKVTTIEVARKFESIALRPFIDSLKIFDPENSDIKYSQHDYKLVKIQFDKITKEFETLEKQFVGLDRTSLWQTVNKMLTYNASDAGAKEKEKLKMYSEHPEMIDKN